MKFDSINIEMEKMLVRKSSHYKKDSENNRNVVLMNTLKAIFKTIIERIRRISVMDKFSY